MKLIGKRGKSRLFYIVAGVTLPTLQKYVIVRFVVDTGATMTCIGMKDSLKNNLNILTFERVEDGILGIGGSIDTFRLPNCKIYFPSNDDKYHTEPIEEYVLGLNNIITFILFFL